MDSLDVFSWDIDFTTGTLSHSDNAQRVTGRSPKTLAEGLAAVHPDDVALIEAAFAPAGNHGDGVDYEVRALVPGDVFGWYRVRGTVLREADGRPRRAFGIADNITARKRAEEALRRSEERHEFLLRLSDALRPLTAPADVAYTAATVLGEHLGVSRAFYFEVEHEQDGYVHVVDRDFYRDRQAPSMIGRYPQSAFGDAVLIDLVQGRIAAVADIEQLPGLSASARGAYDTTRVRAFVVVPHLKGGRYAGGLVVLSTDPREWTPQEIELVQDTAQRTWADVERARAEQRLRLLNEQLEQRVRERRTEIDALFNRLVRTQEEERRRIARDIHDQLGQQMTALRMNLETLASRAGPHADLAPHARRAQHLAEEIDRSVDFLTWDLRPAALDHLGLAAALEKLVLVWSERFGIAAEFDAGDTESIRLVRDVESHVYRLAQEALHNIVKHAQATHVAVSLQRRDCDVLLVIEDNGRGFDLGEARQSSGAGGFGLVTMRERAALIGGSLDIESAPRRGTTIFVRMPIAPAGETPP